jgi:hypothetical protein
MALGGEGVDQLVKPHDGETAAVARRCVA